MLLQFYYWALACGFAADQSPWISNRWTEAVKIFLRGKYKRYSIAKRLWLASASSGRHQKISIASLQAEDILIFLQEVDTIGTPSLKNHGLLQPLLAVTKRLASLLFSWGHLNFWILHTANQALWFSSAPRAFRLSNPLPLKSLIETNFIALFGVTIE